MESRLSAPGVALGLAADETGVQTTCNGRVGRPFYDGPAVGKERHLVGVAPEFQHKFVVANSAVRLKAGAEVGEVHWAMALVNLHGVPATERNVRPPFACHVNKFSRAGAASRLGMTRPQLRSFISPNVPGEQRPPHFGTGAYQILQRLGHGDRRHQVYGRIQDSGGLTSFYCSARRFGENARQTSRFAGKTINGKALA